MFINYDQINIMSTYGLSMSCQSPNPPNNVLFMIYVAQDEL